MRRTLRKLTTPTWLAIAMLSIVGVEAPPLWAAAAQPLRVEIDGGGGDLHRNVAARLSIAQRRGRVPEAEARELYARARNEVELALQPFGHYAPSVWSGFENQRGRWVARFQIDPGPVTRECADSASTPAPPAASSRSVRPGEPPIGIGELHVTSGVYRAYGQNLVIERGRLVCRRTPIANPELDVRAARHARDGVVAGFEVRGPLATPRFVVFSEPVMAERDALSYIVLGRRIERASELEQGILADAAASLGLEGGTFVAGSLARELGIQETSIQSDGAFEDASLMLGTYLSPRLYVNYGVGLLDPVSTLRIQYFLNKKWTLQAETGADRKAEVLYTIERAPS